MAARHLAADSGAARRSRSNFGPGDLYGFDFAGKSQVLNVVLSDLAGFDANVSGQATRATLVTSSTDLSGSR